MKIKRKEKTEVTCMDRDIAKLFIANSQLLCLSLNFNEKRKMHEMRYGFIRIRMRLSRMQRKGSQDDKGKKKAACLSVSFHSFRPTELDKTEEILYLQFQSFISDKAIKKDAKQKVVQQKQLGYREGLSTLTSLTPLHAQPCLSYRVCRIRSKIQRKRRGPKPTLYFAGFRIR